MSVARILLRSCAAFLIPVDYVSITSILSRIKFPLIKDTMINEPHFAIGIPCQAISAP